MQQPLIVSGAFGGHQDAGQSVVGRRHDAPLTGARCGQDIETVAFQLRGDASHAFAGNGVGLDVAMDDEDREFQVFIHARSLRTVFLQGRSVRSKGTAH